MIAAANLTAAEMGQQSMMDHTLENLTPHTKALVGVVGSHAYGLARQGSDVDLRGIYVATTREVLGIYNIPETIDRNEPDICLHEVSKFIRLALACNPNILEMLYLEKYEALTEEGKLLVKNREAFLSSRVRDTYCGYAVSQVKRLMTRASKGDASFGSDLRKRYSKHARHCFRLIAQGNELLTTGNLTVKVEDPDYLFWIGEQAPDKLEKLFLEEFNQLKEADSILPEEPDRPTVNKVLLKIREMNP